MTLLFIVIGMVGVATIIAMFLADLLDDAEGDIWS